MSEAQRDQNTKTVILGYDATSGAPIEVAIDPSTGRILAEIVPVASIDTPTEMTLLKRDQNAMTVMGAYNETTEEIEPIYIDHNNGGIIADVVVE